MRGGPMTLRGAKSALVKNVSAPWELALMQEQQEHAKLAGANYMLPSYRSIHTKVVSFFQKNRTTALATLESDLWAVVDEEVSYLPDLGVPFLDEIGTWSNVMQGLIVRLAETKGASTPALIPVFVSNAIARELLGSELQSELVFYITYGTQETAPKVDGAGERILACLLGIKGVHDSYWVAVQWTLAEFAPETRNATLGRLESLYGGVVDVVWEMMGGATFGPNFVRFYRKDPSWFHGTGGLTEVCTSQLMHTLMTEPTLKDEEVAWLGARMLAGSRTIGKEVWDSYMAIGWRKEHFGGGVYTEALAWVLTQPLFEKKRDFYLGGLVRRMQGQRVPGSISNVGASIIALRPDIAEVALAADNVVEAHIGFSKKFAPLDKLSLDLATLVGGADLLIADRFDGVQVAIQKAPQKTGLALRDLTLLLTKVPDFNRRMDYLRQAGAPVAERIGMEIPKSTDGLNVESLLHLALLIHMGQAGYDVLKQRFGVARDAGSEAAVLAKLLAHAMHGTAAVAVHRGPQGTRMKEIVGVLVDVEQEVLGLPKRIDAIKGARDALWKSYMGSGWLLHLDGVDEVTIEGKKYSVAELWAKLEFMDKGMDGISGVDVYKGIVKNAKFRLGRADQLFVLIAKWLMDSSSKEGDPDEEAETGDASARLSTMGQVAEGDLQFSSQALKYLRGGPG